MTDFALTPSSPVSNEEENYTIVNGTLDSSNSSWYCPIYLELTVTSAFFCVPCIFGLVGNGAVIWLLGFRLKRSSFTTYILNLAVADFGVLLSVIPIAVYFILVNNCMLPSFLPFAISIGLLHFMFSTSQFLLTSISIDRCVASLCPIWYRCHRPENLSAILCALVWIFCFLLHGMCETFGFLGVLETPRIRLYVFLVAAMVCLPLITVASLILATKFCFKTQQRQRKKLLMAILFALFFFLFLAFPLNVLYLMDVLPLSSYDVYYRPSLLSFSVGYLCASVNSFVNPLIYFLIGRKKRGLCRENLRLILQRVFKQEEEVYGEELQSSVETQISAQCLELHVPRLLPQSEHSQLG